VKERGGGLCLREERKWSERAWSDGGESIYRNRNSGNLALALPNAKTPFLRMKSESK
jgi:hypothetical protein